MTNTNSLFKKITSLFLSLVFVLTSFAVVDFSKSTAIEAKADAQEYFLMAYFTGNGDATTTTSENQAIRFAVSNDGKASCHHYHRKRWCKTGIHNRTV